MPLELISAFFTVDPLILISGNFFWQACCKTLIELFKEKAVKLKIKKIIPWVLVWLFMSASSCGEAFENLSKNLGHEIIGEYSGDNCRVNIRFAKTWTIN